MDFHTKMLRVLNRPWAARTFTNSKTLRAVMSAATEGAAKKMATSSVPYLHARSRSQRSVHTRDDGRDR